MRRKTLLAPYRWLAIMDAYWTLLSEGRGKEAKELRRNYNKAE